MNSYLNLVGILILVVSCVFSEKFVPKWKKQACEIPASKNEQSHYTCTDDGEVECLPGWNGDLCDVPRCKSGCDPLLGYCNKPNECLCKLGYWGENCDKCIPLPGCQHGYCNKSFECICKEGWDGIFCNEQKPFHINHQHYFLNDNRRIAPQSFNGLYGRPYPAENVDNPHAVCKADCHSSRGYCEQPGECRCKLGWSGPSCQNCQIMPGCVHGYCQKPLECKCYPGWVGVLCHIPLCAKTCHREHGYCKKPGECRCKVGWWGKNCEKCFPYPGCVNGSCRYPWECVCKKGWGGMLCDEELSYCEKNLDTCKNGAMCLSMPKDEGHFRCLCREGTYGRHCELPHSATTSANPFVSTKSTTTTTQATKVTNATVNDISTDEDGDEVTENKIEHDEDEEFHLDESFDESLKNETRIKKN